MEKDWYRYAKELEEYSKKLEAENEKLKFQAIRHPNPWCNNCKEPDCNPTDKCDWIRKFQKIEKESKQLKAENEKMKKHIQSKYTAVWNDIKKSYDVKADLTSF